MTNTNSFSDNQDWQSSNTTTTSTSTNDANDTTQESTISRSFGPNTDLTDPEKQSKRHLKRQLKQQSRIRKYEMRWSQASGRNDAAVADRARSELREYLTVLQQEPGSLWYHDDFPSYYKDFCKDPTIPLPSIQRIENEAAESSRLTANRRWMNREIWQKLVNRIILPTLHHPDERNETINNNSINSNININININVNPTIDDNNANISNNDGPSRKQIQTMQARCLLDHMTKGTQTESMFENDAALIGYTRQKFMERALLAWKSLDRLYPLSLTHNAFSTQLWQQLLQVRSMLSIGCGPGCDAVGVLTFLKQQQQQQQHDSNHPHDNTCILDRIVLMDFVMPQWKRLVLDHLSWIVTMESSLVLKVDTATCDIKYSLTRDERNAEAWECLVGDNASSVDLIVISYLLTETRGQWTEFVHDLLVDYCLDKSCLLLLSEPKAWQLHLFTTLFVEYVEGYQWLDSSRDSPHLQPLERRLGPAVLLLRTKGKYKG